MDHDTSLFGLQTSGGFTLDTSTLEDYDYDSHGHGGDFPYIYNSSYIVLSPSVDLGVSVGDAPSFFYELETHYTQTTTVDQIAEYDSLESTVISSSYSTT